MMKTLKLYDCEPYLTKAKATVFECLPSREGIAVSLDQTCFFAAGGGQMSDNGTLGGRDVLRVYEKEGVVWHVVKDAPAVGDRVEIVIDPEKRRDDIEIHTGEHILSGTALKLFGVKNVGFHIGRDFATADFDRVLSAEEIAILEHMCNVIIRENRPVSVSYPPRAELPSLGLRKMPETDEDIRVVVIEEADACACCGTHAKRTGEVGLIKVLSDEKIRGGTRLSFLCGRKATEHISAAYAVLSGLSRSYSTRPEKLPALLEAEREELKEKKITVSTLEREIARLVFEKYEDGKTRHLAMTVPYGMNVLKEIAALVSAKEGLSAELYGEGYYVLAKNAASDFDIARKNDELRAKGASGGGKDCYYAGKLK